MSVHAIVSAVTEKIIGRSKPSRGRYLAALDQDDLCHPDRLGAQVAYLDAHPETVLVATATRQLRGSAIYPSALPPVTSPALLMNGTSLRSRMRLCTGLL